MGTDSSEEDWPIGQGSSKPLPHATVREQWIVCTIQIQGYRHNASSCRDRQCRQFAGCRCVRDRPARQCHAIITDWAHRQRAAPAPTIPVAFLRWLLKRHDLAFPRTHAWRDQERAPPKSANTPHKSWCAPRSSGPRPKPTSTVRAASWPARSWRRRSGLRRNARPPRPGGRARDLGRSVCWLAGRVLRKVAERGVDHKTSRCYVTAAEGCAGTPESRR